jgi:hypothetical protein
MSKSRSAAPPSPARCLGSRWLHPIALFQAEDAHFRLGEAPGHRGAGRAGADDQHVTGVGGTWYWNRYPGARFDSESYSYSYSFSKELLEEWNWSEHFAGQPETLRYLNHVADKFDLRRDIQFRSRVAAAHYQDARGWDVTLEDGSRFARRAS